MAELPPAAEERALTVTGNPSCPADLGTAVGLPRPRVTWTPQRRGVPTGEPPRALPAPWINGEQITDGDWFNLRLDLDAHRVHTERLCAVCGLAVAGPIVYLRFRGPGSGDGRPWTSGPGAHPVCATIAARHCPHLVRQYTADPAAVIAYSWDRAGQGYVVPDGDTWTVYDNELRLLEGVTPLTLAALTALARTQPRTGASGCPVGHTQAGASGAVAPVAPAAR